MASQQVEQIQEAKPKDIDAKEMKWPRPIYQTASVFAP